MFKLKHLVKVKKKNKISIMLDNEGNEIPVNYIVYNICFSNGRELILQEEEFNNLFERA